MNPEHEDEIRETEARQLASAQASADAAREAGMAEGVVIGQPRLVGSFPQTVVAATVETRKWPAWTMEVPVWDVERSRERSRPIESVKLPRREFDWHIALLELSSEAMNGSPGTPRFVPPDAETAADVRRYELRVLQEAEHRVEQMRDDAPPGWTFERPELRGAYPHTRLSCRVAVLNGRGADFGRRVWDPEACRTRGAPTRSPIEFDAAEMLELAGRLQTDATATAERRAVLTRRAECAFMHRGDEDLRTAVVVPEPGPDAVYRVSCHAGGEDPLADPSFDDRFDDVDVTSVDEALVAAARWVGGDHRVRPADIPPRVLDWHVWRLLGGRAE